jgi:uncharacterized protein (DUF1697 family)
MARYVAFLRGINVTGRRIGNPELRSHFEEMGFDDVAPFRASGNVIFDAAKMRSSEITRRIERELARSLGYEVPTYLRTAAQVRAIAAHEPFAAKLVDASKGKLQVAMLPARPSKSKRDQVLALATDEDRLAIRDRELYWLPSGGTVDSELDLKAIAELLGPWTMRTKATVEQIAAKYF